MKYILYISNYRNPFSGSEQSFQESSRSIDLSSSSGSLNSVPIDQNTLSYIQQAFKDIYAFIKNNQCDHGWDSFELGWSSTDSLRSLLTLQQTKNTWQIQALQNVRRRQKTTKYGNNHSKKLFCQLLLHRLRYRFIKSLIFWFVQSKWSRIH